MKKGFFLLGLLVCSITAMAQDDILLVTFEGTCRQTNEFGQLKTITMNNRSILRECAIEHGITNLNALALVYHVNGDLNGDVIQVVNKTNGVVLCHVLGFFFPLHMPIEDGSKAVKFTYVFDEIGGENVGSAVIKQKPVMDQNGNPVRPQFLGVANFFLAAEGTNGLRICTGNFTTGKRFVVP